MVMRINGLGQGLLADRRMLGERQSRHRDQPEGAPRQPQDTVERSFGRSEQLRAEFAALNGAIEQAEDALALVAAAQDGLGRVAAQLEAAEDALRTPTAESADALREALAAIEQIAETASFGRLRLLDGSLGCSGMAVGDGLAFVAAGEHTRSSPPQGYEVLLHAEPVRATVLGDRPLTAERIGAGVQLVLREGGCVARLTTRRGQTARQVAAALDEAARNAGLALLVEATEDGRLIVQHRQFGAAHRFAVASSLAGVLSTLEGGPRIVANGQDIGGTIHGEPCSGEGQSLTGCADNAATAGLVVRYTGLPYTGATHQLPRRRPAILEPRVFAGRVVVAQQALTFRLGRGPDETVHVRLDSVRPRHLALDSAGSAGAASLAAASAETATARHAARRLVAQARDEIETRRGALRAVARGRLTTALARMRVQAQNVAAASQDLLAPGAALQAVQALSEHILRESRSALSAQTNPPQHSLLELLGEQGSRGRDPRWN